MILIDGEKKYACCTKPEDGMNIIFKRADLDVIRKKRIKQYIQGDIEACN